jgi:hypothetical protein
VKLLDFCRKDRSSATSEDLYVVRTTLVEELAHVGKVLDVAALVRRHSYGLSVFLDCTVYNFLYRAVVSEVDDLATGSLNDSAHHIDRCVVSVEQRCCGDNANLVGG